MRTTITLDEDVVKTIREEMKDGEGKSFKEAVNQLIRLGRHFKNGRPASKRKPFKVKAKDLGSYSYINYDKTSGMLSELDEEEFIRKVGEPRKGKLVR
ncbi:MAG: hypothetical protein HOP17_12215 [Acidobacteria bacterium]|nr:hypothetical protein [Acidobacteriota bacterium]